MAKAAAIAARISHYNSYTAKVAAMAAGINKPPKLSARQGY
jgi:hypothetical protein